MTNKTLKALGMLLELIVVLLILSYFGMRIWLYARFDSILINADYKEFVDNAMITPSVPKNILVAYSEIHNFDHNATTNLFLAKIPFEMFSQKSGITADCPCVRTNYRLVNETWDRWTVGLHLDKNIGSLKCLEYHLNNFNFLYGLIGIRKASLYYFDKEVEDLTELESLKLCLMTKNPDLYNPKTNPERVKTKLKEYTDL